MGACRRGADRQLAGLPHLRDLSSGLTTMSILSLGPVFWKRRYPRCPAFSLGAVSFSVA